MKKVLTFFLVLLLILSVSVTAYAAVCPVVDMAEVLTSEEQSQLINLLAPYGNRAVQIVTVASLDGENVEDYAERWAEDGIGVVFLIAVQERRWCITTSPAYEAALDGKVIDGISAACVPYLKADDYYGAFLTFAEECGYYLEDYTPTYADAYVNNGDDGIGGFGRFLICLLIGLAAGGITTGIMAGKNKSVRPKNSAADYVRSGSMEVRVSRDIFLYQHVTRIPKPQSSSSSGGGSRSTRSGGF